MFALYIFLCIFVLNNKQIEIMLDGYTNTGKTITYDNGAIFQVYSKETKTVTRFYRWTLGRFFSVSKNDIK